MMHLPAELCRRYKLRPGDRVDLRPTKDGILLERIPSLMEGFGQYRGLAKKWAVESLEEKRAEIAREEAELAGATPASDLLPRPRRGGRGPKIRA
jgi:bifunctional DNA-binding transcriptional regulator/antitoxin component of YhaV-PrlF toxin-antitoxin module